MEKFDVTRRKTLLGLGGLLALPFVVSQTNEERDPKSLEARTANPIIATDDKVAYILTSMYEHHTGYGGCLDWEVRAYSLEDPQHLWSSFITAHTSKSEGMRGHQPALLMDREKLYVIIGSTITPMVKDDGSQKVWLEQEYPSEANVSPLQYGATEFYAIRFGDKVTAAELAPSNKQLVVVAGNDLLAQFYFFDTQSGKLVMYTKKETPGVYSRSNPECLNKK